MRKTLKSIIGAIFLSVILCIPALADFRISSTAYINMLSEVSNDVSADPKGKTLAFADAEGAMAKSTSSIKKLTADADSIGVGLMHPSVAHSYIRLPGEVLGNIYGLNLPITIIAELKGSYSANTVSGNMGSVALGSIYWTTYDGNGGSGMIASQGGIPAMQRLIGDVEIQTTVVPKIKVVILGVPIEFELSPRDLEDLCIEPLEPSEKAEWNFYAGLISGAVEAFGLASCNILPGTEVSAGFDVTHTFISNIRMLNTIRWNGTFLLHISAHASSSAWPAHGASSYTARISHFLATVPNDYPYDIEGISVKIGNKTVPLTRN